MKHGNDAGQDTQGLKHKLKKTDRLGQARQAVKLQKQDRNGVRHVRHQARAHQSKACSQKGPDIARKADFQEDAGRLICSFGNRTNR